MSTEGAVGRLGDDEQRGWELCRKGGGEQRVGRAMGREAERLAEGAIGLRERSNCLAMSGASRAI